MKIPVYILEEHHEAFLVWILAAKSGLIAETDNILYHFDDHSDMSVPKLNKPLQDVLRWSEKQVREFTYTELDIASFILAAGFTGTLSHVCWIQTDMPRSGVTDMYITSYNDDYQTIFAGALNTASQPLIQSDHRILKYERANPANFHPVKKNGILLDIDLDYFSCETNPETRNEVILEVTAEQYDEFQQQQYHPLKFAVHRVDAMIQNNRYYLVINYYKSVIPSPRKVTPEKIRERINDFIALLRGKCIIPALITICRSRFSGYTPEDQWEMIEKMLLTGLKELYQTDLAYVDPLSDQSCHVNDKQLSDGEKNQAFTQPTKF